MFPWRLCVLAGFMSATLAFEDDIEVNYSYFNEITDGVTPEPTVSSEPCASQDLSKWDKIFTMLENSEMRENMLLQYADDVVKVKMDSLQSELIRFVAQNSGSCGAEVETTVRQIALQLEGRLEDQLRDLTSAADRSDHVEATLQHLLTAAQTQTSRLSKLESSCFGSPGSSTGISTKAGFQLPGGGSGHRDQEVTSQCALDVVETQLQEIQEKLEDVQNWSKQRYLPAGCEMGLLFPMRSRRIYVMVVPDAPLSLSSFTVCMWVKPTATTNKTVLFSYGNRQNPYEIQLLLAHTSLLFTVGGEAHLVEAQGAVEPGRWSHLCGEWSSEQGQAQLWADGKKVASTSGVAEGHVLPDGGLLQLGQERNGCCGGGGGGMPGFEGGFDSKLAFAGKMTGVNMWDRGLTEEEISQLAFRGGQGCQQRGNMVAWSVSEMVPHGGAQFIH
ncbi:pentraxin-related protein PTX3 [Oryzias melastigma]|uniref:Pentraxin 3, long b n=1 Tax=Oryzias melastigma TaxID=30732 RepID=A0A3B3D261_ORYME|nr:pentraxin-related protein PTX3 [Oryzias melastigma]